MTSIAKFNQWQTTAGVLRSAVIKVYSSTSGTVQSISQSGSGENRGNAYYDLSGMSITLTPASSSSRFLIFGKLCLGTSTSDNYNLHWRILRNNSEVGSGVPGSYSWGAHGQIRQWSPSTPYHVPFQHVDSPATTSNITYKIQACQTNFALPVYFNRGNETGWQSADSSTLTVMEIQV